MQSPIQQQQPQHTSQSTGENEKPLLVRMAERLGNVEPEKLWNVLKNDCFKVPFGQQPTNEQLMMLCIVAEQYGLNPLTKEIYAFPDKGGIIPVIGVDGWVSILRRQPDYQGYEFRYSDNMLRMPGAEVDGIEWIECTMHIKGMTSITVREHLDEVYKPPRKGRSGPWQTHTKRMHRHKVLIQAIRMAFGFSGVYDADEAENIRNNRAKEGSEVDITPSSPSSSLLPPADDSDLSESEHYLRKQLLARAEDKHCWRAAMEWVQKHPNLGEAVKKRFLNDLTESELMHSPLGTDDATVKHLVDTCGMSETDARDAVEADRAGVEEAGTSDDVA